MVRRNIWPQIIVIEDSDDCVEETGRYYYGGGQINFVHFSGETIERVDTMEHTFTIQTSQKTFTKPDGQWIDTLRLQNSEENCQVTYKSDVHQAWQYVSTLVELVAVAVENYVDLLVLQLLNVPPPVSSNRAS